MSIIFLNLYEISSLTSEFQTGLTKKNSGLGEGCYHKIKETFVNTDYKKTHNKVR